MDSSKDVNLGEQLRFWVNQPDIRRHISVQFIQHSSYTISIYWSLPPPWDSQKNQRQDGQTGLAYNCVRKTVPERSQVDISEVFRFH